MIKIEKLIKSYGQGELELVALKNIDLDIESGEFTAVIGPSGAGKSTLLYQMSLLDEPTSGEVFINGVKTSNLNQTQKTIFRLNRFGFVFQDYALLPELNSIENVALPILMLGFPKDEAYLKANEALIKVGLQDKRYNLPSQLSGGQQQRVSIARAIAHNPEILFADEPTANLDYANGKLIMEAFMELNSAGQTIVMITHEEEYAHYARRVISLFDGKIISDKTK